MSTDNASDAKIVTGEVHVPRTVCTAAVRMTDAHVTSLLLSTSPEKDLLVRDDLPPFRVPPAWRPSPFTNPSPFESVRRGMSSDGRETAIVHVSRHPGRARRDSNLSLEIMSSYVNVSCVTSRALAFSPPAGNLVTTLCQTRMPLNSSVVVQLRRQRTRDTLQHCSPQGDRGIKPLPVGRERRQMAELSTCPACSISSSSRLVDISPWHEVAVTPPEWPAPASRAFPRLGKRTCHNRISALTQEWGNTSVRLRGDAPRLPVQKQNEHAYTHHQSRDEGKCITCTLVTYRFSFSCFWCSRLLGRVSCIRHKVW